MFKRRAFDASHGDGESSSDSDSDHSQPPAERLEDISESEESESLSEPDSEPAKGPPWKCAICPKVLILSELSLATHLQSKRHSRAVKRQQPGLPDPVYAAKGEFPPGYPNPDEEEAETHTERMARVRAEHAAPVAVATGKTATEKAEGAKKQRNKKPKQ